MAIYKHKVFHKWTKAQGLTNNALKKAIVELDNGLYDANLGGGLYKKRIALPGQGKSGSSRTFVAFKEGEKAFFIYGFAKNLRANINANEKKVYRKLAKDFLNMNTAQIEKMIENGKLFEVK